MSSPLSKLAKLLASPATSRTGTPLRHARGVVVSSTVGQSVVTLDGGSTQVDVFNPSHAQQLPAGTVVDVLLVGRKGHILAAYGLITPWTAISFGTGMGNWGGGQRPCQYMRDALGFVHLRGLASVSSGATSGSVIAALPAALAPGATETFSTTLNGTFSTRIDIDPNGQILLEQSTATFPLSAASYLPLNGITFQPG